ncbi:hypothetical protein ES708_23354 [subsurface metagenome]
MSIRVFFLLFLLFTMKMADGFHRGDTGQNNLAATSSKEVDIVLITNAPDGQVTHYLLGNFGKTVTSEQKLVIALPKHVKHLIVYSEYPDLAGRGYLEKSDRVLYTSHWDDVLRILQGYHGAEARVAVYPSAEIQYCAYQ